MKRILLLSLVFAPLLQARDFKGEFSQVNSSGPDCDGIFRHTQYEAKHVLTGPTGHTSVLHFKDLEPGTEPGFFDGMTLVGLLGYSGDIRAERSVTKGDFTYQIFSEGYLGPQFLYTELSVQKFARSEILCTASGEFSSFSPR